MPFDHPIPRPFTSNSVETYAPISSGLYGISNAREWIYIGEAENIRSALLNHLRDTQTALMRREPTGFVFEVCTQDRWQGRQNRLVQEYEPSCNRGFAR